MRTMHGHVPMLHDYLSHSAHRLSDKVALVCTKQRITYGELDARSNSLAHRLVEAGVRRGDRVVVFADNTVECIVAFWAILKANAVVSIVNPLTKSDKLSYILNDCRPTVLITDQHLHSVFAGPARACSHLRLVIVSGAGAKLTELNNAQSWDDALAAGDSDVAPERKCIDIDLAAIIYTSGSTGDPKGVMLTHRNMLTACTSITSYLERGTQGERKG